MGKQSSRLYYQGKDHKDIYFQGKYHDAMYKGKELVWHKIKREGYYSIIIKDSDKDILYVLTFNESEGKFKIIKQIRRKEETEAKYVTLLAVADSERLYVSTLGVNNLIATSIDGINWGETNLIYQDNTDLLISQWYSTNFIGQWSRGDAFYITKRNVSYKNGEYNVEYKTFSTRLEGGNATMYFRNRSDIALYEKRGRMGVYDLENEVYEGEVYRQPSDADFESVSYSRLTYANGVNIFFATESYKTDSVFTYHYKVYIYYSFDGKNFQNTFLYELRGKINTGAIELVYRFVFYREGIYYLYFPTTEKGTTFMSVILTSDFKHFSMKKLSETIKIGNETLHTNSFRAFEGTLRPGNVEVEEFFYNGERAIPEDGMILYYDTDDNKELIVYIDNMFFRESSGNKILDLDIRT